MMGLKELTSKGHINMVLLSFSCRDGVCPPENSLHYVSGQADPAPTVNYLIVTTDYLIYYCTVTVNGLRTLCAYSSKYLVQSVSTSKPYLLQPEPQ